MKKVIFLASGFPRGSAETEKQKLILKIFSNNNYSALILGKKNFYNNNFKYKGEVDGIKYLYATFYYKKKSNKYLNKALQYIGKISEKIIILIKNPDVLIMSTRSFFDIFIYSILSKLTGSKTVLTHVEDIDSLNKGGTIKKLNNYLFNKYAFRIVDGALPISDYLFERIKENAPDCKQFKLPVLVNYEEFQTPENPSPDFKEQLNFNYFLYCASVAYKDVIDFIIKSYLSIKTKHKLILLINGHKDDINKLKEKYKSENDNIIIYSGIEYRNLIYLYKNSLALLIPLRENIQDKARFPHKIGEYCAAGRPIITNNWGEIPNYFTHLVNAYVCSSYSLDQYIDAMNYILTNNDSAEEIGRRAKQLAQGSFDYNAYSETLENFITNL